MTDTAVTARRELIAWAKPHPKHGRVRNHVAVMCLHMRDAERYPAVRSLLQRDIEHLEQIARER